MARKLFTIFIGIIGLLYCSLIQHEAEVQRQPSRPLLAPEVPSSVKPSEKQAVLSGAYPFDLIQQRFRRDRALLAVCLLKNPQFGARRIRISVEWDGVASLRKIHLQPNPGDRVKDCMQLLMESWKLPPHPGMQPFSYRTLLIPVGF